MSEEQRKVDRKTPLYLKILAPVVLGVLLIIGWQALVSAQVMPKTLLPGPSDVWKRLWFDLSQTDLLDRTLITIWEAILGCIVASCVALPLGYIIARFQVAEAAVSPYVAASQAVPGIAIAPLLVIWVGYGLRPIVILCSLMVFFPVLLAARLGFLSADKEYLEAAQLDGANAWQLMIHIQFPLALPAIMTGLRNGFTMSITGAVVGEFVMGGEGLGLVIATQSANIDATGLFSTILVLCALAISVYLVLMLIEKLIDPLAPVRACKRYPQRKVHEGEIHETQNVSSISISHRSNDHRRIGVLKEAS